AQVGWDLAGPPERQAALASGPDGTGSDGRRRRVGPGSCPPGVAAGPAGGLASRRSRPERRRPHPLTGLFGRTIDRIGHHCVVGRCLLYLAVSPIDRAVSISGVGCAHDSPLRVLLVASLLVPGLTRTAGDSRLSRGLVP